MKRLCALALFLLLPLLSAQAADLKSVFVSSGGVFPCDGVHRGVYWANSTGQDIYLKKIRAWQGLGLGTIADVGFTVYASHIGEAEPQVLLNSAWDHYAEPTGQHGVEISYAPDYVRLRPDEWLTFVFGCNVLRGTSFGFESNWTIYYTKE